jgi:hypothetical protein
VLIVHHTGKRTDVKVERGSSALRGQVDTMIELAMGQNKVMTVKCTRQKDAEAFGSIKLKLDCFDIAVEDGPLNSCNPVAAGPGEASENRLPALNEGEQKTLNALAGLGGFGSSGSWQEATNLAEKTFQNHRRRLLDKGYVIAFPGIRFGYQLTDFGNATAKRLPSAGQADGPTDNAATATPHIGVAGAAGVAENGVNQ